MATALNGRLVRQSNKEPLKGVTIEATNVATGVSGGNATTDAQGFYQITSLANATYFAKPLVPGDDWMLTPDTNVIFGGALYIPDSTTLPRIQITNAAFGGIVGLNTGDTYSDATGVGTYQFKLNQNDGKAYFGGGAAVLDTTGVTVTALALGSTTSDYAVLQNTTAATSGQDQVSPALRFSGTAWSGAASVTNDIRLWMDKSVVGGLGFNTFRVAFQASGGGYINKFGIQNDGKAAINTSLKVGGSGLTEFVASETFEVTGTASVSSKLRVGSAVTPTVALDVTGAALISSTLGVTGAATVGSLVTTGTVDSANVTIRDGVAQLDIINLGDAVGKTASIKLRTVGGWGSMIRTYQGGGWVEICDSAGTAVKWAFTDTDFDIPLSGQRINWAAGAFTLTGTVAGAQTDNLDWKAEWGGLSTVFQINRYKGVGVGGAAPAFRRVDVFNSADSIMYQMLRRAADATGHLLANQGFWATG